jgi:hypothetical protein
VASLGVMGNHSIKNTFMWRWGNPDGANASIIPMGLCMSVPFTCSPIRASSDADPHK